MATRPTTKKTPEEIAEIQRKNGEMIAAHPKSLKNRPVEEARKIQSMGGKAAGEKKRQNRTFKQALAWALDMPAMKGNKVISRLAKQYPGLTNREAMAIAMVTEAIQEQSTKAFLAVRDTVGEAPAPPIDPNRPLHPSLGGNELKITIETVGGAGAFQLPTGAVQSPEPLFVSASTLVDVPVEETLTAAIEAKLPEDDPDTEDED